MRRKAAAAKGCYAIRLRRGPVIVVGADWAARVDSRQAMAADTWWGVSAGRDVWRVRHILDCAPSPCHLGISGGAIHWAAKVDSGQARAADAWQGINAGADVWRVRRFSTGRRRQTIQIVIC